METRQIVCDACGCDTTHSSTRIDIGRRLAADLSRKMLNFCGFRCFDCWRKRQKHERELWREYERKLHEGLSKFDSRPLPPDDELRRVKDDIRAKAIAAFPSHKGSSPPDRGGI